MTALFIVFCLFTTLYLFLIYQILKTDKMNLYKFILIILCVLGIVSMSMLLAFEYGDKRGHIKMYQENPKYEMRILYNEHQEPVDTLYVEIKK